MACRDKPAITIRRRSALYFGCQFGCQHNKGPLPHGVMALTNALKFRIFREPAKGFEPLTCCLRNAYSLFVIGHLRTPNPGNTTLGTLSCSSLYADVRWLWGQNWSQPARYCGISLVLSAKLGTHESKRPLLFCLVLKSEHGSQLGSPPRQPRAFVQRMTRRITWRLDTPFDQIITPSLD